MDYAHFIGFSLLGFAPALAIFFLLRAKRRARIRSLAWWFSLMLGGVVCFYAMSHSTIPSFSSRITVVGTAYGYVQRTDYRHDPIFGFRLVRASGEVINIETKILLPEWVDGRTFRVVYLGGSKRILENEAVDITILSGSHKGFRGSLDARPFGKWLGIPIGAALLGFGFMGLRCRRDDVQSAISDVDGNTQQLIDA
jgi:hypothetical protein